MHTSKELLDPWDGHNADLPRATRGQRAQAFSQFLLLLSLSNSHSIQPHAGRFGKVSASLDPGSQMKDVMDKTRFWKFENARQFVHGLNLGGQKNWEEWCQSGERPDYIPAKPDQTYKTKGWLSWADWLGYGKGQLPSNVFWDFEKARQFAHGLNLSGKTEWSEWCRSGERPDYIPSVPDQTYKTKGWLSWADWLGFGKGQLPTNVFWEFNEARQFAHGLNLGSNKEWKEWCGSGERPDYIPTNPDQTYKTKGWLSYPDWLGYRPKRTGQRSSKFLVFNEARQFAYKLNFGSKTEWQEWCRSGDRPDNIPARPDITYKTKGWLSWADWLGYGKGQLPSNVFRDFEKARQFVHGLNLSGKMEWTEWCRSGERPDYIPAAPDKTYKTKGWLSWADWLGYGKGHLPTNVFWEFEKARHFVHGLNLGSQTEWEEWCRSGERPDYIPSMPDRTYKTKGWLSYPDWLGYGKGQSR